MMQGWGKMGARGWGARMDKGETPKSSQTPGKEKGVTPRGNKRTPARAWGGGKCQEREVRGQLRVREGVGACSAGS